MRTRKATFFLICAIAISIGVAWGLKIRSDRAERLAKGTAMAHLRVLAFEGLFPQDLVSAFESENGIRVELTEVATPEELWQVLEKATSASGAPAYDLVTLFSYQVPLAAQLGRIEELEPSALVNIENVSSDFRKLPGERGHEWVVPLLWGVNGFLVSPEVTSETQSWAEMVKDPKLKGKVGFLNSTMDVLRLISPMPTGGEAALEKSLQPIANQVVFANDFLDASSLLEKTPPALVVQMSQAEAAELPESYRSWKFVLPKEKGFFWVLSLAMARDAESKTEGYRFIDYLHEHESSVMLVKTFHQASVNKTLEQSGEIDARLKPSSLRQMPLDQVDLYQDFSRAREMRALLPAVAPVREKAEAPGPQPVIRMGAAVKGTPTPKVTLAPETPTPVPTATPKPTVTPRPTATPKPSATPTATPVATPKASPSATSTPKPTPRPTATPKPKPSPTPEEATEPALEALPSATPLPQQTPAVTSPTPFPEPQSGTESGASEGLPDPAAELATDSAEDESPVGN